MQPMVAVSSTVTTYGPFGSCMLPMRSLWSTSNVPGQLASAAEADGARARMVTAATASPTRVLLNWVMAASLCTNS